MPYYVMKAYQDFHEEEIIYYTFITVHIFVIRGFYIYINLNILFSIFTLLY